MKPTEKLLILIPKLETTEFIGLARVLKVKLMDEVNPDAADPKERYAARDFADVLDDVMRAFDNTSRARKREILQLIKAATKKEAN